MPSKKAQRTKGNVKPSSSSQAAQLLAASGQAPTGFIGFSSQPAFVPASEVLEDSDSNLDSDFRFVLRKFSKRDTTTKIKTLHEFCSLCRDKDEESLKAVLPFWSRIYNKMAIDVDHKVRELSQTALSVLASRVGKSIAPQLKLIIGTWLVSQCDSYPTVASAATAAFDAIFPGAKQAEALRYCKSDILQCLSTNILKVTPQTLSDPLTTSAEDMESKYQRVVGSSLQALRKLLFGLPRDALESLATELTELLNNGSFWKHAKSSVSNVKTGVLSVLSAVCQLNPEVSAQFLPKISPLVVLCLNSADPALMSQSWEAILSLAQAHDNCWQYVNWQKAVWPAVKTTLETGCSGQATVIAPCLLPLLHSLPEKNFALIFNAFRLGLNEDAVLNSPSACCALVRSFVECIRYSIKYISASSVQNKLLETKAIVEDQMMVVVDASLTHPKASLSRTDLYSLFTPVLTSLRDLDPDSEASTWADLSKFVISHLMLQHKPPDERAEDGGKNLATHVFHRLPLLALGIVYQESRSDARKEKVRFSPAQKVSAQILQAKQKQALSIAAEKFYTDVLVASYVMSELPGPNASLYFNLFKELTVIHIPNSAPDRLLAGKEDRITQNVLSDLNVIDKYNSPQCSQDSLASSIKISLSIQDADNRNSHLDFICDHLLEGLVNEATEPEGGDKRYSGMLAVFFAFVAHVDEDKGVEFLRTVLNSIQQPTAVCEFIEEMLGLSQGVPACRRLIEEGVVGLRIEELTRCLAEGSAVTPSPNTSHALWQMLNTALGLTDDNTSVMASASCLDAIVSSYIATLQQFLTSQAQSSESDGIISVVRMAQDTFVKKKLATHPQLRGIVMSLLTIRLQNCDLDPDVEKEMDAVIETGVRLILNQCTQEERLQHLESVCDLVQSYVRHSLKDLHGLSRVINVIDVVDKSASCNAGSDKQCGEDRGDEVSSADKSSPVTDRESVLPDLCDKLVIPLHTLELSQEQQVLEYLYIQGRLPLPPGPPTSGCENRSVSLQSYTFVSLYNMRVMNMVAEGSRGQAEVSRDELHLDVLSGLAYALLLVREAHKMNSQALQESQVILEELRSGVLASLASLTQQQMSQVFHTCLQRDTERQDLRLGVLKLVTEDLGVSGMSTVLSQSQQQYLLRYSNREEQPDVTDFSAEGICTGFASATTVILDEHPVNLWNLSNCVLGYVDLATSINLMTLEVKKQLFQHLTDILKQLKEKDIHLLTGGDEDSSKDLLNLNTCIARSLRAVMISHNDAFWELCLCTLVEWIQYLSESGVKCWAGVETKAFFVSVCELANVAASTFKSAKVVQEISDDCPEDCFTEKAKTEWEEFFSEGVFSPLIPLFVSLASNKSLATQVHSDVMLTALSKAVILCPVSLVRTHHLPPHLTVTDTSQLPDSLKTLLNHLAPLLMSQHRSVQLTAHHLLASVVGDIPSHEVSDIKENSEEEEIRPPPEALIENVDSCSHYLDGLMVASVGEQFEMEVGSEEDSKATGYLLTWSLLLQLFRCSQNLLRAKYASYFKTHESVSHLLDHLFRLMPAKPSASTLEFDLSHAVEGEPSVDCLPGLAVFVYRQCLETLPALVRVWWVGQDRKSSNFVDRFTSQSLSQDLIVRQISASSTNTNMEGITIRARPAVREVSATYEMEEVSVTLTVSLPENFPLGKLEVACDRRVGVSQGQWDRWLMQLNIFLQHQNGSLEEGLRMWKSNIDKKFEGIDDCMVCFSVIHTTTFQLPRLSCKTCHKKFHSVCLYKWFSTSQKSSCPLCRNLF